jgi:ribonuclease E
MTKRMLIDATHAEETRVVVLDGNRLEDFDVETSTKRQLKGNIYLAKVVRVEPSLQAAFVEYGGNRHGFLAFSEIHPDYYQIPVADRQRILEWEAEEARREEEEEDLEIALSRSQESGFAPAPAAPEAVWEQAAEEPAAPELTAESWASPATPSLFARIEPEAVPQTGATAEGWAFASTPNLTAGEPETAPETAIPAEPESWALPGLPRLLAAPAEHMQSLAVEVERIVGGEPDDDSETYYDDGDQIEVLPPPETVGGGSDNDNGDDHRERRVPSRFMRNYKIQEVIRRRQILLVQVVKEERGTKGAALTTYISLAGRFGVLMPNSPRGGGISRKITSATDRRRLKEVMAELNIPRGMGMIVRTAGANRPKPEIKRDCEYLLRLWDDIRELTMKSVAPALIYEEASLIKRSIRDVYSRDIEEILVDGEEGWKAAHDFMRMLMPSHAKKVQLWRDNGQPLFARNQVEAQLDAMLLPTVQLKSGGYLVINQAEALVAIDVNSGRSTRERNIEETALRTNLEAADEVARQLRLRDLAGLIVIDFIDMESKRHNAMVEKRIKEALKNDRARIQVGHISHFGLLEMSRQRLRPSLAETSFIACPHCGGTGHVRSTENAAIHVLRGIEDEGSKRRSAEIVVNVSTQIALYLLNHKRERLREIELRYAMRVIIAADDSQIAPQFRIDRAKVRSPDEVLPVVTAERPMPAEVFEVEDDEDEEPDVSASSDDDDDSDDENGDQGGGDKPGASAEENERGRRRRRRRRRGGRRDDQQAAAGDDTPRDAAQGDFALDETGPGEMTPNIIVQDGIVRDEIAPDGENAGIAIAEPGAESAADDENTEAGAEGAAGTDDDGRGRRRGRRGGRRRRRDGDELSPVALPGADQPDLPPVYAGPTPADPFGGRVFDIFDIMDQVEQERQAPRPAPAEIVNRSAPEPEPAVAEPVTAETPEPVTALAAEPVAAAPAEPAGDAAAEIVNTAAPEPAGEQQVAEPEAPAASESGIAPEPAPEPAIVEPEAAAAEPAVPEPAAAEPVATEPAAAEPPPPEPVAAEPAAPEPPPENENAIKPIVIGSPDEPPAPPKRGWWRR